MNRTYGWGVSTTNSENVCRTRQTTKAGPDEKRLFVGAVGPELPQQRFGVDDFPELLDLSVTNPGE